MDILQSITFSIPEYILKGLADESFIRKNGVIYNASGGIVQHLQEVSNITPLISTGTMVITASTVAIVSVAFMMVIKQCNIIKDKLNQITETLQNINLKLTEIINNQVYDVIKDIRHGWNCLQEADYQSAQTVFRQSRSSIESFLLLNPMFSILHPELYKLLLQSYEFNFKFEMIALSMGQKENVNKSNTIYNSYLNFIEIIKNSYRQTYLNNPTHFNSLFSKKNIHSIFQFEKNIQESSPQALKKWTQAIQPLLMNQNLSQELSLGNKTITLSITS